MRIAQISDTHISRDFPARTADLERCIAQINALDPLPDVVIHTGDISHDGLPEQYDIARNLLNTLQAPWFVMAGNRDKREPLTHTFFNGSFPTPNFPFVQYAIDRFPVRLICLDTLCTTSNKGELCQIRLDDLQRMLDAPTDQPTAIFMHHPPFEVTAAPDPMQFVDRDVADACLKIIASHRSVYGLFCGHVHRPAAIQIGALPAHVMTAVALDLRFGEKEPPTADTPLFRLYDVDPSGPAHEVENRLENIT